MKNGATYKKGMTLVEVLIAMVVLSIGVSSLMIAMSRCLAVVSAVRHRENARNLMRQVDIENPLISKDMEESSEEDEFEDHEGYRWKRTVEMVDEEEKPGLFMVTTRITWAEKGRASYEEVITYKYAPDAESVTSKF